jgi:uncharacterized HAD superfamily protein
VIKMAKIAIDIDETICYTNNAMIKYFKKYVDPNINHNPFYKTTNKEENKKIIEIFQTIVLKEDLNFMDPITNAEKIIKKLDINNKIYLITARHINLAKRTKLWVEKHFENIFFEEIKHIEYKELLDIVKDKDEICKELGIDVLIDDNLENAIKCSKIGIPVILFDLNGEYHWNKSSEKLSKNIIRVKNWIEVYKVLNKKFNIY